MTEKQLREKVVNTMRAWAGATQGDKVHKSIVDTYNTHKPLARSYKVKYDDAWCATGVSAVSIINGLTDIMPTECGCGQMIALYQKLGRWVERDNYKPNVGDVIFYDWDDSGKGDNTGWSDHVGLIVSVSGNVISVIECNKSKKVGYRTINVDGKFIRGYGVPDYASKCKSEPVVSKPVVNKGDVKTVTVTLNVLEKGSEGEQVKTLQRLLVAMGYSVGSAGVDGDFGSDTLSAVKKYQKDKGLTVDGIVGTNTWNSLLK